METLAKVYCSEFDLAVMSKSYYLSYQERLENEDALIQHGKRLQAETKKTADITLKIVEDTKMVG